MNAPQWVMQQLEIAFSVASPLSLIRNLVELHQVDVRSWANSVHGPSQIPFRWACKHASSAWKCEFVTWLLDECGYPLNGTYAVLYKDETRTSLSLLDYLLWHTGLGCAQVFFMLWQRGARSTRGLSEILTRMRPTAWTGPNDFKERCEFLLDRGAVPNFGAADECVLIMFAERRLARQRAIALLSMRNKRPDLRGVVPRELWEQMARYLWSLRFYVK